MVDEHQRLRVRLGAYALGAVDGAERDMVARHVATCAECRAELVQLRRVADRLSLLRERPADLPEARAPRPTAHADQDETVVALRPRAARRREGWRKEGLPVLAGTAAAAFVLLVGGLVNGLTQQRDPLDAAQAQESGPPPVAFTRAPAGVTGTAQVRDWGWGSQIEVQISGLQGDRPHTVWLEQPGGARVPAGSFTPNGGDLTMTFGAGVTVAGSTALGVSDPDGATVLRAELPAS